MAFQLTASRRGWQSYRFVIVYHIHFNSQPHEEADKTISCICRKSFISTHSLTKRLTKRLERFKDRFAHFNSQPHEEADFLLLHIFYSILFQLTASRRGWQDILFRYCIQTLSFQLTASRRGWLQLHSIQRDRWNFNSQPHEEADQQRDL